MNDPVDVVILSVPYCEPLPMVAPVLLAGCLSAAGIPAKGIDFSIQFIEKFSDSSSYIEFKNFLTIGHMINPKFPSGLYKDILSFTKKFLLDIKKQHDPKYIGLSIFTSESLDFGLILSYMIRRWLPGVKIVAGGKGLEVSGPEGSKHYESWIDNGVADLIIVGDAESEFIDSIKKNKNGLVFAQPQKKEDLDSIPLAKWEDYDLQIYSKMNAHLDRDLAVEEPYLAVTASKGCVRKCTFCDVASFWPDYIYRDPVKVAEEIIHNYRNTGITKFKFTDNLINGSISNFRTMNQILVKEIPNTIKYSGFAIFRGKNQMPEDDFRLAAEAGCSKWTIGVESGSERVRWEMKKKFDNEDLDWSVRMLYKYKIQQNWLFIVGYPSETEKDFQDTLDMLKRYQAMASTNLVTVSVTPTFMLLDNSPLLSDPVMAERYGLSHLKGTTGMMNKFWTSTKFLDNDYPTRSRRWKEFVALSRELGYQFGPGMPIQKYQDEIENADKIYREQTNKIFSIYPSR